jgi:hypothetical protein
MFLESFDARLSCTGLKFVINGSDETRSEWIKSSSINILKQAFCCQWQPLFQILHLAKQKLLIQAIPEEPEIVDLKNYISEILCNALRTFGNLLDDGLC